MDETDFMLKELIKELDQTGNSAKAQILCGFFKTGKGQYGEGDIFLGITVPQSRKIAKKYKKLDFDELEKLLHSKIHEHRLIALLILLEKFQEEKKLTYEFYLKNILQVNNWDLVDSSADKIIGEFLFSKNKKLLYEFARSKNLWIRRISIISTFNFIKKGKFSETLKISEMLLDDKHDLIHKAVGWMLREVGKRNQEVEEEFLKKHYKKMPRTMLRYAIERFSVEKKKFYMKK